MDCTLLNRYTSVTIQLKCRNWWCEFFSLARQELARWIGILLAVTNAAREEKALHLQLGKRMIFIALLSDNQILMN